jgi:hypothetical protein
MDAPTIVRLGAGGRCATDADSLPLTGSSTKNEAPRSGSDSSRMRPPCSWTIA